MASSIDFGSLSASGAAPRLSGTSSGLDTEALVQALTDAKRLPALRIENQITTNETKIAAYSDLRGLLSKLQSSVESLRNPPGLNGTDQNAFETKEAYFSSSTTTPPTDLLGISTSNSTANGSFDVVVEQIAAARKFSSASTSSSSQSLADAWNSGTAFSESITIGLAGSGNAASIAVDGTMSIYDLSAAINAQTEDASVRASVLKVSDTDYRLVVTANETGVDIDLGGDSATLSNMGFSSDGGATFANSLQAPKSALLKVDGVTVTRTSNTISDAIEGVTFNLFQADTETTVSVDIEPALGDVKSKIEDFVSGYNEIRDFIDQQRSIDESGTVGEDAVLFGDTTLRNIDLALSNIVGGSVSGLGAGASSSLAAVGISLDSNNRLSIDNDELDSMLLSNIETVRNVFEFRFEADSPDLTVFARGDTLSDTSFAVSIVDSDNDGVIESATIDGVAADIEGNFIKGPADSVYEGLELYWSGIGSATITATATSGVAERLFTDLDSVLDDVDGALTVAADNLDEANDRYRQDITRIDERVELFRERLILRFSALEAALATADAMLNQIRATTAEMQTDDT